MSKRLVVCCDGTWNRPDQPAPTNVPKLALGLAAKGDDDMPQLLHYQKGVGTARFQRFLGGTFGIGLSRNVQDCYRFLVENYEPGDYLYLFGFSRGAYTARSTVGLVRNSGILRREHAGRADEAYRLYRAGGDRRHPKGVEAQIFRRMYSYEPGVHFLGVWDTVGSLGVPLRVPLASSLWGFHDTRLSSIVRNAFHAVAIDERRRPFEPTLWERQGHAKDQTIEQRWFAGVHSDVGGGYEEAELAEIALLWMLERAYACGLRFKPDHFVPKSQGIDERARRLGAEVAPDPLGELHDSLKGVFRFSPRRWRTISRAEDSKVAPSATRRRDELGERYQSPPLDAYIVAEGTPRDAGDRA